MKLHEIATILILVFSGIVALAGANNVAHPPRPEIVSTASGS